MDELMAAVDRLLRDADLLPVTLETELTLFRERLTAAEMAER